VGKLERKPTGTVTKENDPKTVDRHSPPQTLNQFIDSTNSPPCQVVGKRRIAGSSPALEAKLPAGFRGAGRSNPLPHSLGRSPRWDMPSSYKAGFRARESGRNNG